MLTIREEQMSALSQAMVKQFEDSMAIHLRRVFPDETKTITEKDLLYHIELCVNRATQYKITIEGDVQRYLECAVLYGWDFDTKPETYWAGEILCREDLNGEAKMDKIEQHELMCSGR
ncbi:hypothetical protein PN36_32165 [Candidatus Thiomargarita nelsonii]|uniref:Uncharacterized protein n=1 Tax=Candidatus Thiomargarita nelsonii TaxID=1003181 RepID=A0A0A6P4Z0_9GAMM|nr:hypothetical protein PN36_32165 [Candidatus Thiomargarita nelsonii]